MSQVPVSMQVIVYPKNKTVEPFPATIVGYAWITGLEVGGGPMPGGPGAQPPSGAQPEHPIVLPPVEEPPPTDPFPTVSLDVKQPPAEGGWGFKADTGWYYDPGTTAGPKRGR